MVEGLIWLFSLASGRIPPVDCAWTRDNQTLHAGARVVAAAVVHVLIESACELLNLGIIRGMRDYSPTLMLRRQCRKWISN